MKDHRNAREAARYLERLRKLRETQRSAADKKALDYAISLIEGQLVDIET